jgi:protein subunit release factor B
MLFGSAVSWACYPEPPLPSKHHQVASQCSFRAPPWNRGISVKHPNSKSKHKYSTQLMYTAQKSLAVDSETSDIRSEVDLTWDQAKKSGQIWTIFWEICKVYQTVSKHMVNTHRKSKKSLFPNEKKGTEPRDSH